MNEYEIKEKRKEIEEKGNEIEEERNEIEEKRNEIEEDERIEREGINEHRCRTNGMTKQTR